MLAATLITPLMIATAPVAITLPQDTRDSHRTQASESATTLAQRTTWSSTQTHAPGGRPSDNDND